MVSGFAFQRLMFSRRVMLLHAICNMQCDVEVRAPGAEVVTGGAVWLWPYVHICSYFRATR